MKFCGILPSNSTSRLLTPPHHKRGPIRVVPIFLLLLSLLVSIVSGLTPSQGVQAQSTLAPPIFGVPHGIYNAPFMLTLSADAPTTKIRYTTDFTTPSDTLGNLYSGAISISTTTVIRAIAYTSGSNKSAVTTQTYIFPAAVRNQPAAPDLGWPSLFAAQDSDGGPYPADYEMDPEIVNHPNYSSTFESVLKSLPSLSLVTPLPSLFDPSTGIYNHPNEKGILWERAASLEWIDPSGATLGFSENIGIRLHGQASRRSFRTPKKTIRAYFKLEYGSKKLDFKLFDDIDAVGKFDHILLRGGSNRSWPYFSAGQRADTDYVNDEFVRRAFLEMGWLTPHGTYAHLYLNGKYWGLYNITERVGDKFLSAYYGGTDLEYDVIAPDEENSYRPTPDAGTIDAYNAILALINQPVITDDIYAQVKQRLDVVNLADYMIMMHYIANTDWPNHNWYAWRKRVGPDTRLRMLPWDSDTGLRSLSENLTKNDYPDTPARMFLRLQTHPEFRLLVADRFYKHLVNSNGRLLPNRCGERYSALTSLVYEGVVAESARWGDYVRDLYPSANPPSPSQSFPAYLHSRDLPDAYTDPSNQVSDNDQKTWVDVRDYKLSTYCPQRTGIVVNQYKANGWYSDTLKTPVFGQEGGAVAANYNLSISNPNNGTGDIYYTTDGSDPRQAGGAVLPTAINGADAATAIISQVTLVKARIYNAGEWSVLHEATFYPPQPFENLVINELQYHPAAPPLIDEDDFQFIELYNKGNTTLQLDNLYFARGFVYRFPAGVTILPGGFLVLGTHTAQFQARYGFPPFAEFRGDLSNKGEAIELRDAVGNLIDSVTYSDLPPWPIAADGTGPSLSLLNANNDNNQAASWGASQATNGTPGAANDAAGPNQAPTVSVSAPSNGANVPSRTALTIKASASDSGGSIAQVRFYVNGNLIGNCVDSSSPYECVWMPPAVGPFSLSASAIDNSNTSQTSSPVNIQVVNQAPTVTLTAPGNAATFLSLIPITITANANDADGAIVKVEFLSGGNVIAGCTDTVAPYQCIWPAPPAGTYNLMARATDNFTTTTSTSPITITIQNRVPVVQINNPLPGTNLSPGVTTIISANASDLDGTVTQVAFFANTTPIPTCVDTTAPYECMWTPTVETIYALTARATDNLAATGDTLPVSVTVKNQAPVVQLSNPLPGADLSPLQVTMITASASDADGAVTQVTFFANASPIAACVDATAPYECAWTPTAEGSYILTARATDNLAAAGETAPVNVTVTNQAPVVQIDNPLQGAKFAPGQSVSIVAQASDADGAISQVAFFANGIAIPSCVDTTSSYECTWTPTVEADYLLTAQATDNFAANRLSAPISVTVVNQLPSVTIVSPTSGVSMVNSSTVNIVAQASDPDGTVKHVRFLANGVELAGCVDTQAPFECTWLPTVSGQYILSAEVSDNQSATVTSLPITVNVIELNGKLPPSVTISQPTPGTQLPALVPLTILADADDSDGTVTQVAFFANGVALSNCVDTTAPYECSWTPTAGDYTLAAVATDNDGIAVSSPLVGVKVVTVVQQPPSVAIVSPIADARHKAGSALLITANANDADGTIVQVTFFANESAIAGCVDVTAPYECTWMPTAQSYTLRAEALDSQGLVGKSANVTVIVEPEGGEVVFRSYLPVIQK